MGPQDWPPDRQLEIDTVDAFEGREKDIIVLSLVRANRRRDIGFLRLEQRLNVAGSRSRRLIILGGDTSTLRGGAFPHPAAPRPPGWDTRRRRTAWWQRRAPRAAH